MKIHDAIHHSKSAWRLALPLVLLVINSFGLNAQKQYSSTMSIKQQAEALLKKMTLEEKIGQLNLVSVIANTGPTSSKNVDENIQNGNIGNIFSLMGTSKRMRSRLVLADSSRLKIPLLNGLDIIHGYKTIFPIPLGIASSWDPDIVKRSAQVAALEASAMGYNWTFSPMLDITRDPRWGRVMEGYGEDPYLVGLYGASMVKGYQGNHLSGSHSLLTCVKHFAFYGFAEAGKEYNATEVGLASAYNYHFPTYKAAIDAGALSIMASFNSINGVPATSNQWLLTDVLRKQWKFDGFVVTDYNGIAELISHGVAEDLKQATLKSFRAGVDMDMMSEAYTLHLKNLVEEKKISEKQINDAVRKILIAKLQLNLFKNPYRGLDDDNATENILSTANRNIAKEAALKSIVLLKNDKQILPLNKTTKIALIGPFANNKSEMLSSWAFTGSTKEVVTMLEGIKKINSNVVYAQGTQITDDPFLNNRLKITYSDAEQLKLMNEAMDFAKTADVIVVALGESMNMSGESKSMANISLQNIQKKLLHELKTLGKPIVLLLVNGRPMTIEEDLPAADAVIETWRLGTEAGSAIADVLFGNYNPTGKLAMTFPRNVGQIPVYYNHLNTGRPYYDGEAVSDFKSNYKDSSNSPLFPFGFGLSYTQFSLGELKLSKSTLMGDNDKLKVSVTITNTGKYMGEETLQLYIRDFSASIARPVKELKRFRKVSLNPNESKEVTFDITPQDLKFYNQELRYDWEGGKFSVFVGINAEEGKEVSFVWAKQ